jgi:four helix bundle protein
LKDFRQLKVWEKAHQLTLSVYRATGEFPKEERHGLTDQIRRASASIAANIAEGCGRYGENEFSHFLQIAMGSASELDYHLLLASDLGFLQADVYNQLNEDVTEVKRMLNSLILKLKSNRQKLIANR